MTVYNTTVSDIGRGIKEGLMKIAEAIEATAKRPTYNIIVNTNASDPEDTAKSINDILVRIQKRERDIN